jgi:hypothetical protein
MRMFNAFCMLFLNNQIYSSKVYQLMSWNLSLLTQSMEDTSSIYTFLQDTVHVYCVSEESEEISNQTSSVQS